MQASYWLQKWERGEIAFHESDTNPLLLNHMDQLKLASGSRVLVPLCGKTRDIAWLLAQGYHVVGAELSELSIQQLFQELGVVPEIVKAGPLLHYRAHHLDIFVGDIFELSAEVLGPVAAVYDRAALVALPADMRKRYTAQLLNITGAAPQLLITYEYNQQLMEGPPFSLSPDEVRQHYAASHAVHTLATQTAAGGLKGRVTAIETVWLLKKAAH